MSAMPQGTERRQHRRFPLTTGLYCLHEQTGKQLPVRSIDLSSGGMKLLVPPSTPVRPGHRIHLDLSQVPRPELLGRGNEPVCSTVVRVDRSMLVTEGQISVGIRFDE